MAKKEGENNLRLEVPLDASSIEDFDLDHPVKIIVQCADGTVYEQKVRFTEDRKGSVSLSLEKCPGPLHIVVGPADIPKEELLGMQTISLDLPARLLHGKKELSIPPIKISPYYWHWWLIWCRTFTIRGRIVCPNGQPVPGARVCAYDVDMWWWWRSTQQVGCATTDVNGAFEIKFRWCCGWWPWWWWSTRTWHLEPKVADLLLKALPKELKQGNLSSPSPTPDLKIFKEIISQEGIASQTDRIPCNSPATRAISKADIQGKAQILTAVDLSKLEEIRLRLKDRLSVVPELETLHLWPWWPWWPWWDCTPDIIFKATQNCRGQDIVIVEEGYLNTRWNIPQTLNVTLVANDQACCIPPSKPNECPEGNCLVISYACSTLVDNIGGNLGAPATPVGYVNPSTGPVAASTSSDRPFAGDVWIYGTVDCMAGVDYYAFELSRRNDDGTWSPWSPMPDEAVGVFYRVYYDSSVVFPPNNPFFTITVQPQKIPLLNGRLVYETLQHYEDNNPPFNWNLIRVWVNKDTLMRWRTLNNIPDGTYMLRVKGWNLVGNNLTNERILQNCGVSKGESSIALTIDNRFIASGNTDSHGNPCGTVHFCTTEPDTAFLSVNIVRSNGAVEGIGACSGTTIDASDMLQIDFIASDPDGHLAFYTLEATYGINQSNNLLAVGGSLQPVSVTPVIQVGPDYGSALAQGAVAPIWNGGAMRLLVQATKAFPKTCCYQLELRAYKRTIVDCDYDFDHYNISEYSIGITVK
jgi:hypothetical protein